MKDELLEKLAEKVHDSWMDEKKRQGFHHPIPYSELPEQIKELDRVMVREFEKHLEELDCYIVNRKEWKKDDPRALRY